MIKKICSIKKQWKKILHSKSRGNCHISKRKCLWLTNTLQFLSLLWQKYSQDPHNHICRVGSTMCLPGTNSSIDWWPVHGWGQYYPFLASVNEVSLCFPNRQEILTLYISCWYQAVAAAFQLARESSMCPPTLFSLARILIWYLVTESQLILKT